MGAVDRIDLCTMEEHLRRKLSLLAQRVEGKDISIMKEVRIDNCLEELTEINPDGLRVVLSRVSSCTLEEVDAKLAEHDDSERILQDLVIGLTKT